MKIGCIQSPNQDLVALTLIEGLKNIGHTVVGDLGTNGATKGNLDDSSIAFYVEFSNQKVNTELARYLAFKHKKMLVYVNGEDLEDDHLYEIHNDSFRYPSDYHLYFRREFVLSNEPAENERPLQMGVMDLYLDFENKKKDQFAIFPSNGEYANRYSLIEYIKENTIDVKTGRIGSFNHGNPQASREEYFKEINRAKVIIVAHGWGEDTARFWESVATGAIVIAQKFSIEMPHPFTHGKNILFWEHPSQVIEYLNEIRGGKYSGMGKLTKKHALKHHKTGDRALYFMNELRKLDFIRLKTQGAPAIIQVS